MSTPYIIFVDGLAPIRASFQSESVPRVGETIWISDHRGERLVRTKLVVENVHWSVILDKAFTSLTAEIHCVEDKNA